MKTFEELNHYDILRIPAYAEGAEIERAYKEALEIYGIDSLITYSLFTDEQRGALLQSIDEAYDTLINPDKRRAYDGALADSGALPTRAAAPPPEHSAQPPIARQLPVRHRDLHAWVKNKSQEEAIRSLIEDILSHDLVSGRDLMRLREAFGIEIGEIYEKTRIAGSVLKMIEENRFKELPADIFLRNFLRSYAQILQIEPTRIIEGYFKARQSAADS
jgi:curved DNA-binding protein CbpA